MQLCLRDQYVAAVFQRRLLHPVTVLRHVHVRHQHVLPVQIMSSLSCSAHLTHSSAILHQQIDLCLSKFKSEVFMKSDV